MFSREKLEKAAPVLSSLISALFQFVILKSFVSQSSLSELGLISFYQGIFAFTFLIDSFLSQRAAAIVSLGNSTLDKREKALNILSGSLFVSTLIYGFFLVILTTFLLLFSTQWFPSEKEKISESIILYSAITLLVAHPLGVIYSLADPIWSQLEKLKVKVLSCLFALTTALIVMPYWPVLGYYVYSIVASGIGSILALAVLVRLLNFSVSPKTIYRRIFKNLSILPQSYELYSQTMTLKTSSTLGILFEPISKILLGQMNGGLEILGVFEISSQLLSKLRISLCSFSELNTFKARETYQSVGCLDGLLTYLDLQGKKLSVVFLCLGIFAFVIMRYLLLPSEPLWILIQTYFPYLVGWTAYVYMSSFYYASICFDSLRWSLVSNLFLVLINSSLLFAALRIFTPGVFAFVLGFSMLLSCAFGYCLMRREMQPSL